jgi:undecaprenyl-diphosphatase
MNSVQAAILGLIQGFTEFLPVSSSGHLVVFTKLFNLPTDLAFDTVVHFATLFAVVIYFWNDLRKIVVSWISALISLIKTMPSLSKFKGKAIDLYNNDLSFKLGWLVLMGTIPTMAIGFTFKDFFETLFGSPFAVGCFFVVTAVILIGAEMIFSKNSALARGEDKMNLWDAIIVGVFQGCAIAPGISRSGSTISGSLVRGLKRELAARYSFLLAIPAILGAGILQIKKITAADFQILMVGFVFAAISGYVAIDWLMKIIKKYSIRSFAYYLLIAGPIVIMLSLYLKW